MFALRSGQQVGVAGHARARCVLRKLDDCAEFGGRMFSSLPPAVSEASAECK